MIVLETDICDVKDYQPISSASFEFWYENIEPYAIVVVLYAIK